SATAADLASCLIDTHEEQALALADVAYGTTGTIPAVQQTCQSAASKEGQKLAGKRHKLIAGCKDKVGAGKLPAGTDWSIATATSKGALKIASKCSDATVAALAFGAPCAGVSTGTGLGACLLGQHADRDDRLITIEYGAAPGGKTALAKQITDTADCVKGPISRCRANDYLLANDRIRIVVQDLQRNLFGIGQFGGQIIDADLVRTPPDPEGDNFKEWSTAINVENTAHYPSTQVLNDGSDGQAAIIRVPGVDALLDFLNPSTVPAAFGPPPTASPAGANDTDLPI